MKIIRKGIPVTHAILHCAAVGAGWTASHSLQSAVKEIRAWHRAQGWADIGYHYIIHPTGDRIHGRPLDRDGAHTLGHNVGTLGILLLESAPVTRVSAFVDYFTLQQRSAVVELVREHELSRLSGHNDHAAKLCPGFSVADEFPALGLAQRLGQS